MTDYHPVTREELDMIQNQNHLWSNRTMDKVIARPDPLALLEAWLRYMHKLDGVGKNEPFYLYLGDVILMFKQLRENSEAARQQGIDEGWWK